jgi:hypothetical protein
MAVNKDPFVRSKSKDGKAHVFRGPVQAGSTQAIKRGELCVYDKTASNWVPQSAAADFIYPMAIAKEEQKAADSARMIEFYSLHPDDEFEFAIDAARALALGDPFTVTASDSQTLTYSATAFPVARCTDDGHYPETGTTVRNRSYAVVSFSIHCSAWGRLLSGDGLPIQGMITPATAAMTLYTHQSGLKIANTGAAGAVIHVLPQSAPAGCEYEALNTVAQDHGFAPGAAGAAYVEGAKQTDDKDVWTDAIADTLKVTADGNGDWIGQAIIGSAADATGAIDVEG